MKTLFLLLVICMSSMQAQIFEQKVYFGLLATANSTYFDASPSIGSISPDLGYGFSAFLRLRKGSVYGEFEAGYSSHEINVSPDITGTQVSSRYSLAGADLSVLLGWRVVGIGRLGNFRLFTGYNYGNYSKVSIKSNGSQVNDSSIDSGNSGLVGGLGFDFWKIILNLKYVHGLSDISKISNQKINSQYASVSLGYKF